jgi:hypothetical protein
LKTPSSRTVKPGHAAVLGSDAPKFQQSLDSGKYTAKVKSGQAEDTKLCVRSIATFLLRVPGRQKSIEDARSEAS